MVQGPYPIIRQLLRARGWVERKAPRTGRQLEHAGARQREVLLNPRGGAQPVVGRHEGGMGALCPTLPSSLRQSYLARDQLPNFIWTNFLETVDRQLLQEDSVLNHYAWVDAFTTKEGLCLSLQNLPWIEKADPNAFFPRCYRLGTRDDREAFIEDFRLTAARSLLKLALEEAGDRPVRTEQIPNSNNREAQPGSPLYPELVEEALEVCKQHLGVLQHEDIDRNTPSPCRTCIDWDNFLQQYYRVAHEGAGLVLTRQQRKQCQNLLQSLAEKLPQLDMEGKLNVWILKPGAESQGRGIICMTRLEEMLQLAWSCTAPSVQVGRWVVQKYVERLMTIFGTKFDIRQWFVVTDWKPLTVWFYQDCYLRFCSRPFSLHHLERARHLCNVSVQKWYKTSPEQDPRVPPDKIWSNKQFQEYLAQVGQADAWHKVLVPGMKAAILNALRSARDRVRFRKGNFELYGADFVVGENLQPWLLEINSCPTMSPSSAVTRQLCANVQRDTLRLVLDRKDNPRCSIGAFEARHPSPTTVPSAPKPSLSPGRRTTQVPQRARHRSPTTVPSAYKGSVSPAGRTTQGTQPRAATKKLPPLQQQSRCPSTSPDPPAPTKSRASPTRSQGLPRLSHLPEQPRSSGCPLDWVPMPPPRGALRNSWQTQGSARSFPPAKPPQQPHSAQSTGTPCLEQKNTAAPNGMQKTWGTETAPGVDSTLPVLAEPTKAASDPKEIPLLCCGTQLLPCFKMIL
uniref:TTLL3 monoglycylase n=1 Tax=Junco hyemalis TaxID=40217 RepID=A0A8C5NJT9_JUNHY